MGVTRVVRGDDLIDSTPRQILLYRALGLADRSPDLSTTCPLVVGPDGRRLAKRHGDTRLAFYRDRGVPPERVLALLARWCGVAVRDTVTLPALLEAFRSEDLPMAQVVFTSADDSWLRE